MSSESPTPEEILGVLTPRSQEQILARYELVVLNDMFGFEASCYLPYLEYENALPYLKEGTTKEEWEEAREKKTPKEVIKDYLPFAFGKAFNNRGLSAERSVCHLVAWAWLTGDEDFFKAVQNAYEHNYSPYGVPVLRMVCEHYGWKSEDLGDLGGDP